MHNRYVMLVFPKVISEKCDSAAVYVMDRVKGALCNVTTREPCFLEISARRARLARLSHMTRCLKDD